MFVLMKAQHDNSTAYANIYALSLAITTTTTRRTLITNDRLASTSSSNYKSSSSYFSNNSSSRQSRPTAFKRSHSSSTITRTINTCTTTMCPPRPYSTHLFQQVLALSRRSSSSSSSSKHRSSRRATRPATRIAAHRPWRPRRRAATPTRWWARPLRRRRPP